MLKVVIIEDEPLAREELTRLLLGSKVPCEVLAELDSVEDAVEWFNQNQQPDLLLVDIQLSDGVSFEIFKKTIIKAPTIFTTAYQEYAIDAFKLNSIDYLLKPIHQSDIDNALAKFQSIYTTKPESISEDKIDKLLGSLNAGSAYQYKTRFLIKKAESLYQLEVKNTAYFYAEDKLVFAKDNSGKRHLIENTIDQLEQMLNPENYFRISRSHIISTESIGEILKHFNGRLKLNLNPSTSDEVFVARQRVKDFLQWLDR